MVAYFGTYFGDYFGSYFDATESTVVVRNPMYELFKETYTAFADIITLSYADTNASASGIKGRKCIPEQKELDQLADYAASSDIATFVVWDTTMGGVVPKTNGKITWTESGDVWTIRAMWNEHWDTQWRCLCTKDS